MSADEDAGPPAPPAGPASETAPPAPSANANPRQLVRNFLASYVSLGVSMVLGLFLTPLILRHLGQSDYGLWILVTTVGSYVGLLGAGVGTAAVQGVARQTALGDRGAVGEILTTARVSLLVSAVLGLLAAAAFLPFTGTAFGLHGAALGVMRWGLLLVAASSGIGLIQAVPNAALVGAGYSDVTSMVSMALTLLTLAAQLLVVVLGGGVLDLVATTAGSGIAGLLALEVLARRRGPVGRRGYRPTRTRLGDLLRSGGRNVAVSLAGTVTYGLDAFIIGAILSVAKVTPYDVGLSVAAVLQTVATTATNSLLPTYAHSAALNDPERQFRMLTRAVALSLAFFCPATIAVVAFGRPLLGLWLGHVPAQTYEVAVVACSVYLLQIPGHQAFVFLTGVGRNGLLARIALPLCLLNVATSVAATFWLGPPGPLAGDVPQMMVVDFVVLPWLCVGLVGHSYRSYARAALLPLVLPALAAAAAAAGLALTLGTGSRLLAPFQAVAVVLVGLGVYLPVQLRLDPSSSIILRHAGHVLGRVRAGR